MQGRVRSFRVSNVARYPFSYAGPGPMFHPPEDLPSDEHALASWRFGPRAASGDPYLDTARKRRFELVSEHRR